MKRLMILICAAVMLASCGESAKDDNAPVTTADLKAYSASVSDFPSVTADAYAPWARMKADAYTNVHPEDAPAASKVDIPAYPGSYIVRSGTIGEGSTKLDFVTLICEDSYEAVIQFYKDRLIKQRGWTYEDQYNVFQPGEGNEFILQSTPFVSVMDVNPDASEMQDVDAEFLSRFRTRIQVTYRPGE